jgi:hypothetical protein
LYANLDLGRKQSSGLTSQGERTDYEFESDEDDDGDEQQQSADEERADGLSRNTCASQHELKSNRTDQQAR